MPSGGKGGIKEREGEISSRGNGDINERGGGISMRGEEGYQ